MGFPSPAGDYVEQRLTPERICGIGMDSRILETSRGFAVIEPCTRLVQNQVLLILSRRQDSICQGDGQGADL
ncbi:Uncharacterised protein [Leclercia adecarboxylata]|uniref:Uncharacterized protein n=1 Tax=Leclercia adecarboxylata TaxID=83655 RepID=A0A4U9HZP4_9ENTR|nr:Uncharacterised protein [Leclercia adecarboxylata]